MDPMYKAPTHGDNIKEMNITIWLSNFDTTNPSDPTYVSTFDHDRVVTELKKNMLYCN